MPAIPRSRAPSGQVGAPVHLVSTVEDVDALDIPNDAPVAYVTQTTLSVDDTRGVIAALQARFSDLEGPDVADICYATQHRQSAVRELCEVVDLLLVVGSTNSSNSNRLREIGVEKGMPSYLIADGSELDPAWLAGVQTVGLTAGASAPEELVRRRHRGPAPAWPGRGRGNGRRRETYRIPAAQGTSERRRAAGRSSQ